MCRKGVVCARCSIVDTEAEPTVGHAHACHCETRCFPSRKTNYTHHYAVRPSHLRHVSYRNPSRSLPFLLPDSLCTAKKSTYLVLVSSHTRLALISLVFVHP